MTEDVRIAYRETITRTAEAEGKLKKQSGGHGQYAVCQLRVSAAERGEGSAFIDSIVGGASRATSSPRWRRASWSRWRWAACTGSPWST